MQDAKEEVRARLNIEDVIGEYVQLKRAGRNFRGLSPFSGEKTPSFYVSPDKHIWHDFSSSKGGDVFSFIMEVEGMDFRASLEHLARKAGVDLSIYDTKNGQEIAKQKKRLIEANQLAVSYYQQSLLKNQHALEYVFKKRKLSKAVVQDFKIGYAPTSTDALVQFLSKKGFSGNELSQAGLVNRFGGDLFRGRMAIPLMDGSGQVIGFTGRILENDVNAPKYLNTPQTLLYDKSRHVFGLSQAKEAIRTKDYAVIVEGNLDVVSSHQVGIKQVVATAGTAMTDYHLRALIRLTNNVKLAFDGDKAGLAATERAIPIAQNVGVELSIISLPKEFKDPDELIQKDKDLWQRAIDESEPVVDWVLKQYSLRHDLKSANGKRLFTTNALKIVSMLNDSVEKEHYVSKIAEYSNSSIEVLNQKMNQENSLEQKTFKKIVQTQNDDNKEISSRQDDLLSLSLVDSKVREVLRQADLTIFDDDGQREVAKYLVENISKNISDIPKSLQKFDTYVKILILKAETRYVDWNDHDRSLEATRLLRDIEKENKKKQKDILMEKLRDLEESGDDFQADEIRNQLNKLIKEL